MKSSQQKELFENRERVEKSLVVVQNDIPQDIVEEILSRLPVKSVLRFKAVSKLWYSTISNTSFQRRCPASMLFGMSFSTSKQRYEFYLIDEDGGITEFPIPFICKDFTKGPLLSNSCHGMLLLSLHTSDIYLVNPTTHYIDVVLQVQDDCFGKPGKDTSIGFCYDESNGDYKAIVLISQETVGDSVLVASLRVKQWTTIPIPGNFYSILEGPWVHNRLHCTCRHSDDHSGVDNSILYFNPVKDVFEKVECPQPKSGDEDAIIGLGVLEDCLCMARWIGQDEHRGDVEVLKMKEYGVAESWTSLFVLKDIEVNRCDGWFEPLLMTKNGDIWILSQINIYRYNLAKKLYTKVIMKEEFQWKNVVAFVENLSTPNKSPLHSHGVSNECYDCGGFGHTGRNCEQQVNNSDGGRRNSELV